MTSGRPIAAATTGPEPVVRRPALRELRRSHSPGHRQRHADPDASRVAGGMRLIASSDIAVIVRLGLAPGLAGIADPSRNLSMGN